MANSREFSYYDHHDKVTDVRVKETADENGNSALHDAIIECDAVNSITMLLDRGDNIYAKNNDNYTPLDFAIQYNRTESTLLLIKRGALVGENLNSLLLKATEKNNHLIVKMLIDHGIQSNSFIDLKILNFAISQRNSKIIESIIPYCGFSKPEDLFIPKRLVTGEDLNSRLLSAIKQPNQRRFKKLFNYGMQNNQLIDFKMFYDVVVTLRNQSLNENILPRLQLNPSVQGRNHIIKSNSQTDECIKLLLKWNFTIHPDSRYDRYFVYAAVEKGYLEIVLQLLEYGIDVNMVHSKIGFNLLTIACINKHHEVIESLLKHNADVNARIHIDNIKLYNQMNCINNIQIDCSFLQLYIDDSCCVTCLHIAVLYSDPIMTQLLLKHDAKIINDPTLFKLTCQAVHNNSEEIVRILLDYGVNITDIDPQGRTLLHFCVLADCNEINSNFNIAKILLESGANIHLQTPNNKLIYEAINNKHYKVAQLFLDYSTDVQYIIPNDTTLLHNAIEKCFDVKFITTLLKLNSPVNAKNGLEHTPLHVVCKMETNDQLEIIETLLHYNADINCTDHSLMTPLHVACEAQNLKIVKVLLENGANLNVVDHLNHTPLHVVCKHKSDVTASIIQLLLEYNANIEAVDERGWTPLFVACKAVNRDAIKCLLYNNANPNVKNARDRTPFYYVCEYKNDINLKNADMQLLLDYNADIDAINGKGWTPLIAACERADYVVIKFLLNNMANLNATDNKGQTPLHIICKSSSISTVKIIQLLLENNANIEAVDERGWTPLFIACEKVNDVVVKCLLNNNANLHITNNEGQTPLHVVCQSRNDKTLNIIQLLLQHSANIEVVDQRGWTPLFIACENNNYTAVEYLLNNNANINAINNKGRTPLHIICKSTSIITSKIIQLLLEHNANIEATDQRGWTPLFVACDKGNNLVVECLLNNHANPHHTDYNNLTPLYVAIKNYMDILKVVDMLLACKVNIHRIDMWGDSIIHRIVNNCNVELIQRFALTEVNFNSVNKKGNTPLHNAVQKNSILMTKTLIKHGADINILNKNNLTPLQSAIEDKLTRNEIIEILKIQVVKMKAAGLKVNEQNLNIVYNSDDSKINHQKYYYKKDSNCGIQQLEEKCKEEIERMKLENIGIDNITIYNLLKENIHLLGKFVENNETQKVLKLKVYDDKFPLYGDIIKCRFREAKIRYKRYKLMNLARDYFRLNINQQLPDECIDAVLNYLNIEELTKFIESMKLSNG